MTKYSHLEQLLKEKPSLTFVEYCQIVTDEMKRYVSSSSYYNQKAKILADPSSAVQAARVSEQDALGTLPLTTVTLDKTPNAEPTSSRAILDDNPIATSLSEPIPGRHAIVEPSMPTPQQPLSFLKYIRYVIALSLSFYAAIASYHTLSLLFSVSGLADLGLSIFSVAIAIAPFVIAKSYPKEFYINATTSAFLVIDVLIPAIVNGEAQVSRGIVALVLVYYAIQIGVIYHYCKR